MCRRGGEEIAELVGCAYQVDSSGRGVDGDGVQQAGPAAVSSGEQPSPEARAFAGQSDRTPGAAGGGGVEDQDGVGSGRPWAGRVIGLEVAVHEPPRGRAGSCGARR